MFVYSPATKSERHNCWQIYIYYHLNKLDYHFFIRRFENFVFILSARTDAQYYSSFFFSSPVQSLENYFSFAGPASWKKDLSFAGPVSWKYHFSFTGPMQTSCIFSGISRPRNEVKCMHDICRSFPNPPSSFSPASIQLHFQKTE